jgi:hypothetical protein
MPRNRNAEDCQNHDEYEKNGSPRCHAKHSSLPNCNFNLCAARRNKNFAVAAYLEPDRNSMQEPIGGLSESDRGGVAIGVFQRQKHVENYK